jgi:hypothetical protein
MNADYLKLFSVANIKTGGRNEQRAFRETI